MTDPTLLPSDVVPLPENVIGQAQDDSGTVMVDDDGNQIVLSQGDEILSAVYAIAKELRAVSTALTAIQTKLGI